LRTDPIGFIGGLNLYSYTLGNSLNLIDPMGMNAISYIPVIGTVYNLLASPKGANINDYNIPMVCEDDPTSILRCKQDVSNQAGKYAGDYTSTHLGRGVISASVGAAALLVNPVLGAFFMLDAAVNTGISFYKLSLIHEAASQAARLCEK